MKSFEEELEEAADKFAEIHSVHKRELFGNITYDFKAGARWAEERLRREHERERLLAAWAKKYATKFISIGLTMGSPKMIEETREAITLYAEAIEPASAKNLRAKAAALRKLDCTGNNADTKETK